MLICLASFSPANPAPITTIRGKSISGIFICTLCTNLRNIRLKGEYPDEVSGAGFHPARAALRTRDKLLGSPLLNNIGYVVVVLKRNPIEKDLPETVEVNFSAQIEYDSGNAFGVGKAEFRIPVQTDEDFEAERAAQTFLNGRFSVRADNVDPNFATISLYRGDNKINSQRIEKGKISAEVFVPEFYCQGALQVAYDGLIASDDKARIEIGDGGESKSDV